MQGTFYHEEDAIHLAVTSETSIRTQQLDENRYLGFDRQDRLAWVSLLNVSEGVDLEDIFTNKEDYDAANRFMDENGIKVLMV